ncbi:hypothetical protein WJX72_007812 [[Myrmecia] bisecta]|uniref:F-box domain-containing protein n=1 Tax=[Myrmecia] bisecta TaxID=41462 RepID=A0AAW1PWN4_9CHLO
MSDMEDNQPSTSGFSYLPEDVQLDILRMLPGDERKRHLAVVNKEWRALLTDGIAWPDLDLQPVSELSCSWLSTRAKGIRSLRAALVTLDQVKLFNQVLLEAQPALERLELHSHWYCTLHDSYHYVLGALLFTQLQEISFQSVAVDIRYLPTSLTSLHLRDCEVHGMASLARLVNLRELVVDVGMGSGTADFHPGRAAELPRQANL